LLYAPNLASTEDDRHVLRDMLRRYAGSYFISGPERDALVAQTITALAEEPEVLLTSPIEKAIAETMQRVFIENARKRSATSDLKDTGSYI